MIHCGRPCASNMGCMMAGLLAECQCLSCRSALQNRRPATCTRRLLAPAGPQPSEKPEGCFQTRELWLGARHGNMSVMETNGSSTMAPEWMKRLHAWKGRSEVVDDEIARAPLRGLAATLGRADRGIDATSEGGAVRKGDRYMVSGQMVWISRIQHSDLVILLARTTPLSEGRKRSEGFSKALESGAVCVILDLEDAVAPQEKAVARQAVTQSLAALEPAQRARTRWIALRSTPGAPAPWGVVQPGGADGRSACGAPCRAPAAMPIGPGQRP